MIKKVCLTLFLGIMLVGCTFKIGREDSLITTLSAHESFSLGSGCYVTLPDDYALHGKKQQNSGKKAQQAAIQGISKTGVRAVAAVASLNKEEALANAKQANTSVVLVLEILRWEDPPSFIDSMPDYGEVKLSVVDTATGKDLRVDVVECRNIPGHFMRISSSGPEDCLGGAFQKWAQSIPR